MKDLIKYLTEEEHNSIIDTMKKFDGDDTPQIGIFWYDTDEDDLLFVRSTDYNSIKDGVFNKLHKDIWAKEYYRAKAKGKTWKYPNDYKQVPRGRVNYKDGKFVVYVGSWIDKYEKEVSELVKDYFNLREFEFSKDSHWDIGHGFETLNEELFV